MPRIALVTAQAARGLDEDLPPLEDALRKRAAEVHVVEWDDAGVDWSAFDIALLRSTWDYTMRLAQFLEWAERVSRATTLLNPLPVVRWNTDKHYLLDLRRAGVPTVPSEFIEPGEDAAAGIAQFLHRHEAAEFVVKPAVGAGSRDALRCARADRDEAVAHAARLLEAKRAVLLQPYLDRVDEHGETALIFFDGRFSHAIRKGPLLKRGNAPVRALFAPEVITPRTPSEDELRVAEQVLAAVPSGVPLYARVDLVRDADFTPRLLELELTEPSLFFAHGLGSADRFAAAILHRATSPGPSCRAARDRVAWRHE